MHIGGNITANQVSAIQKLRVCFESGKRGCDYCNRATGKLHRDREQR
jgi:hypothetical protein